MVAMMLMVVDMMLMVVVMVRTRLNASRIPPIQLCRRQFGPSGNVADAHTPWVIRIRAVATAPISFSREHVGVTPALVGPVGFVAKHVVACSAFEPINGSIYNADTLRRTPIVPCAHKRAPVKLCHRKIAAAEYGAVKHSLNLRCTH
jgi:hypothetical protein